MDPGLRDPVGIAGELLGSEGPGHPPEVLPVHAVGGEGAADQGDDRHAAVTQPAVHVLAAHGQTLPAPGTPAVVGPAVRPGGGVGVRPVECSLVRNRSGSPPA